MGASVEDSMRPDQRSPETFVDWISRAAAIDVRGGDPIDAKRYVESRTPEWHEALLGSYVELHEQYPGGFRVPELRGRRPLVWERMGTAGEGVGLGGINRSLPFFGPLIYEGLLFPDGIRTPLWMLRVEGTEDAGQSRAKATLLNFVDLIVSYAPMLETGQLAIISEQAAFAIARPGHGVTNPWAIKEIEQDMLRREMHGEDLVAASSVAHLLGYLGLAEAFGAEPVISELHRPVAALIYDYVAEAGYAGAPEQAYSRLPELGFQFHFDPERSPRTLKERAEMIAALSRDEYWSDVRSVVASAAAESSRADFNSRIADGVNDIHTRHNKRRSQPMTFRIARGFGENAAGNLLYLGALGLGSFVGFDEFCQYVKEDAAASTAAGAAIATAGVAGFAAIAARATSRPFVAPDVLTLAMNTVRDPSDAPMSDGERLHRDAIKRFLQNHRERMRQKNG